MERNQIITSVGHNVRINDTTIGKVERIAHNENSIGIIVEVVDNGKKKVYLFSTPKEGIEHTSTCQHVSNLPNTLKNVELV